MKYLVEEIIWGWPLIVILLSLSFYFSVKTRFVQFRYLKLIPKLLFEKNNKSNKFSAFQTVSLILANHIGTGNIVGVAYAICYGGPGAIFWMWMTALICSSLSFMENTLGQLYKTEINGEYRGGTAYYIYRGIGSQFWAYSISTLFLICLGIFMPTIQATTISETLNTTFNINKLLIGILVTVLLGYVIIGNAKRLVRFAEVLIPFMAFFYIIISLVIIISHFNLLDDIIRLIISNAINKKAIYGGIIGKSINIGMRRGIFTHEAGIGTSPNISSSSNVSHPVKQGLLSSFCIFIDTILLCSLTAFIILITNKYNIISENEYLFIGLPNKGYNEFVSEAVNTVFIGWGNLFITISIFLFGFTALFGSFYNAQTNLMFIFQGKKYEKANVVYKIFFLIIIFISSFYKADIAWIITDLGVGVAAFVNIIVLLILNRKVIDALKDFELKYKKKLNLSYYNNELECWRNQVK
ncbi:MAG: alanine:cation symporter family protein [Bacilli bacterium]|nr:alanine:cation symporter family protein [Bacilli bacterium]